MKRQGLGVIPGICERSAVFRKVLHSDGHVCQGIAVLVLNHASDHGETPGIIFISRPLLIRKLAF